jgi:hypothetical protein
MSNIQYDREDETFFKPKKPSSFDKNRKKANKVKHELKLADYTNPDELEEILDNYDE